MIDLDSARLQVVERLPIQARWSIGDIPLEFDFSCSLIPLRPIRPDDINDYEIEADWKALHLFGEWRVEGGANPFLCINGDTGAIFELDIESDSAPVRLLNSNMDRFIRTFLATDSSWRERTNLRDLSASLLEIDPPAYPKSVWKALVDALIAET